MFAAVQEWLKLPWEEEKKQTVFDFRVFAML